MQSSVGYENPVQDVRVTVTFKSPNGKTRTVLGFWNGGKQWGIRFSPDEVGQWTYRTQCSDTDNSGLHDRNGTFRCNPYRGNISLFNHGELQLSKNRRYIEHADGTPFFWLADTVWCGPLFSDEYSWRVFLNNRVEKEFTAIQFVMTQWRMAKTDAEGNPAFTGKDRVAVVPEFFQRMDNYMDAINEAGLMAVPVLLWAIRGDDNPGYTLPESQKIVLAEYMLARYGAHQAIWFLGGDGDYAGEKAETWKRIGRAVFSEDHHRLGTMHVRGKSWVGKEFRSEPWFHFISYQSGHGDDDNTFRWIVKGPPSTQWKNDPPLPVINTEPNYEAHNGYKHRKAHNDHSVRRAAYWSLLVSPPAGITYGGQGIWGWHQKIQAPADHVSTGLGSSWYDAKDLPGAFSMKYLHQLFKTIDWWRLLPAQEVLSSQPGDDNVRKYITAAKTKNGDLLVAYTPDGEPIQLKTDSLKKPAKAMWFHPRTGGWLDAGPIDKSPQTFKPVDKNDWILVIQQK